MYYPYLRGKQFELLALRDFSHENPNNEKIVPIIEPVKQQFNGLNTAISAMLNNGLKFAIILNPKDGDFKHQNVNNDILDCKFNGIDGIRFNSSLHEGGVNVVLFDPQLAICKKVYQREIKQVTINYTK